MKQILVIEDDGILRESLVHLLEIHSFRAIAAANGLAGIQLAQAHRPDLILCDVIMPELDGYGVLSELQQHPATATIPFIFLTSLVAKTALRHGMQLGADDYLTKPCSVEELLGAITSRFAKQSRIHNHAQQQAQQQLDSLCTSITHSLPHEFRTPLNGVLGLTEILIEDYAQIDRQEMLEIAQGVHDSAERLHQLTQNFLLHSELEACQHQEPYLVQCQAERTANPQALIDQVAHSRARQCDRATDLHHHWHPTPDLHHPTVCIADRYLKKIIEELLSNAFKFSPPGAPVHITTEVQDAGFTLQITDQGRGMTATQITHLGPYMQLERQRYEQPGLGLGLAIVKRLVKIHQGQFTLRSLPGQGTTLQITLPIEAAPSEQL